MSPHNEQPSEIALDGRFRMRQGSSESAEESKRTSCLPADLPLVVVGAECLMLDIFQPIALDASKEAVPTMGELIGMRHGRGWCVDTELGGRLLAECGERHRSRRGAPASRAARRGSWRLDGASASPSFPMGREPPSIHAAEHRQRGRGEAQLPASTIPASGTLMVGAIIRYVFEAGYPVSLPYLA